MKIIPFPTRRRPDFHLQDEGAIAILFPRTRVAADWVAANLASDALTWAGGIVIEHRFVADILTGVHDAGLAVRR
jgi:hypothetical protein